jgi:glycosyltransferase involved in cell wall biosynthesis
MKNTATPLVSIVIPTYNRAHYLGRALQSVLDQTYTHWEAIVIDDHSTDNTDEVMESFTDQRITYLKIHNNNVIAASRNSGIRVAKGKWIAFLDSDDWWKTDKLQACFDCINEKVDLVYHNLEIVSDQPQLFSRKTIKSWQVRTPVLMDLLLNGNAIGTSSVVVRKSLLQQIGGINESVEMIAAEDYNTWLRIAQLTEQFVYLPCRLGYYLTHNQSISQKDMSIPRWSALAEFVPMLRSSQKLKLEANLRYAKGQFNYCTENYAEAKENLLFGAKHGYLMLRIKAAVLLFMLMGKLIRRFGKL